MALYGTSLCVYCHSSARHSSSAPAPPCTSSAPARPIQPYEPERPAQQTRRRQSPLEKNLQILVLVFFCFLTKEKFQATTKINQYIMINYENLHQQISLVGLRTERGTFTHRVTSIAKTCIGNKADSTD